VEAPGLKRVHFQELEEEIAEFVRLKRKIELPVTCETTEYKTCELAETHVRWHYFNTGTSFL
jgi:hypothetical protein